jgi:hypothetical protein
MNSPLADAPLSSTNHEFSPDDNLPFPPNISKFSTHQVAYLFNKLHKEEESSYARYQRDMLKKIAIEIIANCFHQLSILDSVTLSSLPPLALMEDVDITNDLLQLLVEKIRNESFLDQNKLHALSLVVHYGGARLDPNDVLETLSLISKKLQTIRVSDDILILQCLESVNDLLDAVLSLNVFGVVKEETIKEIIKTVTELPGTRSNSLIAMEKEYAKQAMIKITFENNQIETSLFVTYSILREVVKASCAVVKIDPIQLIDSVINLYKKGADISNPIRGNRQEEWFLHVRLMKILYASAADDHDGELGFVKFRSYYWELFRRYSGMEMLLAVVQLLKKLVCKKDVKEEIMEGEWMKSVREVAIRDLGSIYYLHWELDGDGTDLSVRSVIVDSLWLYCSIPEEALQIVAKETLIAIVQMTGAPSDRKLHPQRFWLNEIDIRTRGMDHDNFPYSHSHSPRRGNCFTRLTQDAMENKYPLLYLIEGMRQSAFQLCHDDSEASSLRSDLEMYVPLNCSLEPHKVQEFSLLEKTLEFVKGAEKVMLLHGNNGSGKSLFGRWLESQLWQRFRHGDDESVIPIFVSLASLKDPSRGVIEESLFTHGFTQRQMNELRQSSSESYPHCRLLFILDGFDEIQCKLNLYEANGFAKWRNAKVIITSRLEYLFGLGNYLSYFGSSHNLREYCIRPFNVEQRNSFFENIANHRGTNVRRESSHYQNYFDRVKGLGDLVTTPFLLRIVTDILPLLVGSHDEEDDSLSITRSLVFEIFTEQEFVRSRNRLRSISADLVIPEDFDEVTSFRKFSMHLAVSMFVHRETTVSSQGSDYRFNDEKNNKWDEFFSNVNQTVKISRSGAPLTVVRRQWSFRHKSLQEYFAARMLLREVARFSVEEGDADNFFNRRYLFEEPSIRDFLAEMISSNPSTNSNYTSLSMQNHDHLDWKDILLSIIISTRSHPSRSVACGNAFTVLLLLGHSFVGSNLREIHCSGAVFNKGDFRNVNFEGSVFQDCSWDECCLDGCNFRNCDFTNSNLITERSTLQSPFPITSLLNFNKRGVVVTSSINIMSIWSGSSLVKSQQMSVYDLYASPNEQWLFMSGEKGYLYRMDDLDHDVWTTDDLNCIRDAISLTDDELFFGIKSGKDSESCEDSESCVDLFRLKLPASLDGLLKVNDNTMKKLKGVKANITSSNLLFVSYADEGNWSTCSLFSFIPDKNMYQLTCSIRMELIHFDLVPSTPFLFSWCTNRLPFLLHITPTSIKRCPINLPVSQALDSCMSHDGSAMLLRTFDAGFLFSLRNESKELPPTVTKLLQFEGMFGPLSHSQFTADCELVSLVYQSEIRVVRVKCCTCVQVIRFNFELTRVLFNQQDQELLILPRSSLEIFRHRVVLRDDLSFSSPTSPGPPSHEKKFSCLGPI